MKKILVYLLNLLFIILLVFSLYFLKNNHEIESEIEKEDFTVNDNNIIEEPRNLDIFHIPTPPNKLVFKDNYYYLVEKEHFIQTKFIGFFINFNEKKYWEKYDNNKSFLYAYSMENRIRTYTDIDDGYTKNRFELYAENDSYEFLEIEGHNVYERYKKGDKYEKK